MSDDLRTILLKKDAKIGELLARIEENASRHSEIVSALEKQVSLLEERLSVADSAFVDKCRACGRVERHKETKRIIAFLAEHSRKTQMKSIESEDEVEKAILLHDHEVIKDVIEKIQTKFPENEESAVEDEDDDDDEEEEEEEDPDGHIMDPEDDEW